MTLTGGRSDSGAMLAQVIVAMVLFAVCVPVMLTAYARATAMAWNATAEQQAAAVAAWYAAEAADTGCDEIPAALVTQLLPGDKFLPHEGFAVTCDDPKVAWPLDPAPDPLGPAPDPAACAPDSVCGQVTVIEVAWMRLDGTDRSLTLSTVTEP